MELSKHSGDGQSQFKVKLSSGRVLGPLDLPRIRLLILKGQIIGKELAREHPQGEWKDINQFPEIADLLVEKAAGSLASRPTKEARPVDPMAATLVLSSGKELPGAEQPRDISMNLGALPELETRSSAESQTPQQKELNQAPQKIDKIELVEGKPEEGERTIIGSLVEGVEIQEEEVEEAVEEEVEVGFHTISHENTVVFQRSTVSESLPGKKKKGPKEILLSILAAVLIGSFGYDLLLSEPEKSSATRLQPVRPRLPEYIKGQADPSKSAQVYLQAMKYYVLDTVTGYRTAAEKLRFAASLDIGNVKALAMLASSYINLIDSSNKDENYFSVISKLIDLSRAKAVDLSETVIADVEFYLVINKAEAAQSRIVEYTKSHQNYGLEMFYYLASTFLARGDPALAARYLGQIPDNKAFSAKIFYLRGEVAEKLRDFDSALLEYKKGIRFNPMHARSHLKIAQLLNKQGKLKEGSPRLDFLINHVELLTPDELGLTYYLHGQLAELNQKWDLALGDVERAVKLDPDNHDYLLELYTLRARAGDSLQTVQKQARMYYFMGEGEKLIQQGRYQDALIPLLQARQANDRSPLPLIKIGDMFNYIHDIQNARINYKLAADRAPDSIQVWSKYIESLIQSYEWDEARKAMDRFRKLPVGQSAIDKAAADMYQKQGQYVEAQVLYRKAMARDLIDPDVYIAYAKSLMSTKNFKEAPIFFALALRFDPLNVDSIVNTAKCTAETESIDRGIQMLQDEMKQNSGSGAEFLAAIAEFEIQKGDWEQAQLNVDLAMKANPNYAYPWKLQAQIYVNRESSDKDALNKALLAYKSYSERNASDPSGYLERYKIFIKKTKFEEAKEELARIYQIYPRYPNLHYYFGVLYSVQGNHKVAADEFKSEILNNPTSFTTLIAYGNELMELSSYVEALKLFTRAMQLTPQSSDAKQNAGWANYRLKNFQAAIALLRAALAIDQANPAIHKRLGIVYRDMGDFPGACAAFRKYLEMEPDAPDRAQFQSCF